ncbi:porin [Nitrosomonas communis]|uniref:Putative beta-barrel porin-2, OmpL-like. bbp2 n=1 Tax=Nitrosomonas communis TaxID=44574 RepID=A0A1I4NSW5_9PROT|nr:porin [Nitrosomonas communis]SFM18612.1 Putative beta-barrel porin-2, OmpL-like. bbp2 [Nitrosomonas communis]
MRINSKCRKQRISAAVMGLLLFGMSSTVVAANTAMTFLEKSGVNLDQYGLKVGGWVQGGATFNPYITDGFNGPVTFADQANRFQLNQLNLFFERPVVTEGNSWDIGFRADFLFGTDAIFTQAYGNPAFDVNDGRALSDRGNWDLDICCNSSRTYGIAFPQAFAEVYAPVTDNRGVNVKIGHFYTPIGYETVPAPNNFFYTHAYTMQYGEPFTHTGLLGEYAITDNWSVIAGALTGSGTGGWDGNFDKQLANWGAIGGLTWTSDDGDTSLNISGTGSTTSTRHSDFWGMFSIVLKHMITSKTHFVLQHDHGFADNVLLNNLHFTNVNKNAEWYGINMHLYYDVTSDLSIGVRGEWFRDRDGFRVFSPGRVSLATDHLGQSYALGGSTQLATSSPSDYYAVTLGLNWKPGKMFNFTDSLRQLNIRPNFRYDVADPLHGSSYRPFGGNNDQVLLSLDAILPF